VSVRRFSGICDAHSGVSIFALGLWFGVVNSRHFVTVEIGLADVLVFKFRVFEFFEYLDV